MSARTGASDTSPEVIALQIEYWRQASFADKAEQVAALNRDVRQLAKTGIRLRYPDASDREVFLRLSALCNGRDLTLAVYGWDADIEGW